LGYKVRLAWIPSHTGSIAPNDFVDKRANDARHHGVSVSCPAPRAHTASLLKRASERECADRRQRRVVQDHIAAGPKLAGLVIGHERHYRGYVHRIDRASDPYCQKPQWVHANGSLGQFSISKERMKTLERLLS
ncbi:hypothetical protein FOZ63_020337, partial [Perkinsus olseni]